MFSDNTPSDNVEINWNASKISYRGEFDAGKQNGYGILEKSNGQRYAGQWLDGNMNGKGIYNFEDGSEYIGEYRINQRNGYGELKLSNGVIYKCNWLNGKPVSGVIVSATGKTKKIESS